MLNQVYYIIIYDQHGNQSMSIEFELHPSNEDLANALEANGGYSVKTDYRFKLS